MKKLLLVALILLMVLFPAITVLANPPGVPHRDPAQVPGEMWLDQLFLAYAAVFDLIKAEDYQSARDLLGEISNAEIPPELSYLVQRGTALGIDFNTSLGRLRSLLDEASRQIDAHQLEGAEVSLVKASEEIEVARETLTEIQEAVGALSQRLGFSLMLPRLSDAYARVNGSLQSLQDLIAEFERQLLKLEDARRAVLQSEDARRAVLQSGLVATELQISVLPTEVFWGEIFIVSGNLTSDGVGLGGREVSLLVGGHKRSLSSRDDGSFSREITAIPDDYSGNLEVTAVYDATGEDASRYLPTESRTVTVRVGFNTTGLEVTAPQNAFAGQPVTLSGRIVAGDLTQPRTIRVSLDGAQLMEGVSRGDFNIDLVLPAQSSPGEHNLEVAVLPQGSYAGAKRQLPLNLLPGIITAEVKTPGVIFSPRTVRLSGLVSAGGMPLGNATVQVGLGKGQASTRTGIDGNFAAALKPPLAPFMTGTQKLHINIIPDQPWLAPLQIAPTVMVISPLVTGLLALALLVLGFFMVRLVIVRRPAAAATLLPDSQSGGEVVVTTGEVPGLSGKGSEIISAYADALKLVARVCGAPEPHATLREYLAVARRLNGAFISFQELTTLTELALYASRMPEESQVARSARLVADIKKELG